MEMWDAYRMFNRQNIVSAYEIYSERKTTPFTAISDN